MKLHGIIEKGWGSEEIWISGNKYCSKFMHFNENAKFSMHFHAEKEETWYVMSGVFVVKIINTVDASIQIRKLVPGDIWHNECLIPHQLICHSAGTILEVSTPDSVEDNYRVMPGDSQT